MDACVNHKRATRNKPKFVIKDGVLHYITKELMHKCFQKKEMQPFPLTRIIRTAPLHQSYLPLSDRQVAERPLYPCKSNANGILTCQWLCSNCCKIVTTYFISDQTVTYFISDQTVTYFISDQTVVLFDMDIRYTL